MGDVSLLPTPGGLQGRLRPDIEGLRAVAILLVVLYHARIPGIGGGFIGVDVFFVLSGYLITGLLVREVSRGGGLNLAQFYARRARRLLPAAALMLLVTLAAGRFILSPLGLKRVGSTGVATSLYASNLYFIRQATNYQAHGAHDNPLLHTWSLAVEEQFYLVWPLLLLVGATLVRRSGARHRLVALLGVVGLVSFGLCIWLTRTVQPWAFFGSPLRAWEFAAGGVTVLLPVAPGDGGRLRLLAGWVGLGVIAVGAAGIGATTPFPGLAALLPVVGTVLVLISYSPEEGAGAGWLLGRPPLQRIGKLSYSWYLWHWPVFVYATVLRVPGTVPVRLGLAAISLGLAGLSHRMVENPIRHHPGLVRRPALTLALACCLTLACGAVCGWSWRYSSRVLATPAQRNFTAAAEAEPSPPGCQLGYLAQSGSICEFGDTTASTIVVLFGDSHATQWLPALDRIARARAWRLRLVSKGDCPPEIVDVFSPVLQRPYRECSSWRRAMLARIRRWHPQFVLISGASEYAKDRERFGLTFAQMAVGLRRTVAQLEPSGARLVLLRDTPRPGFSVPECLSRAAFSPLWLGGGCGVTRAQAVDTAMFALEHQVAASDPDVAAVDLTDDFCDSRACSPMIDGKVVYKDSNHMSVAFSASLAQVLARALDRVEGGTTLRGS